MKTLFLLAFVAFSLNLMSQTYISDKQEVSGTWSKSGSPYIIQGEAIVPTGKTLKIKPGVVVKFKTGTDRDYTNDGVKSRTFDVGFLRVKGTLIAKGSKKKFITFTHDNNGTWGNVCVNSNKSESFFQYCKFEYSYYLRGVIPGDNATGSLTFIGCGGTVQNCIFANNGWTAFNCKQSASPTFTNNVIYNNEYAIECNTGSSPFIQNCIIWNNRNGFYVNGNSKPKISYSLTQDSNLPDAAIDEGYNILNKNPMFKDERNNNFSLKKESPCIKTGKKGEAMRAY